MEYDDHFDVAFLKGELKNADFANVARLEWLVRSHDVVRQLLSDLRWRQSYGQWHASLATVVLVLANSRFDYIEDHTPLADMPHRRHWDRNGEDPCYDGRLKKTRCYTQSCQFDLFAQDGLYYSSYTEWLYKIISCGINAEISRILVANEN